MQQQQTDMKLADILTEEVIAEALERYWRGTSGYCLVCGRPQ